MALKEFIRRRWRLLLSTITLLAMVALVIALHSHLGGVLKNLSRVSIGVLLLMVPLQLINYDAQARLYRSLFRIVGNRFRYRDMYSAAVELNFVNHVFPSGGVTGISYFGARLKSKTLSGSRATVVQLFKLVLVFMSFELILLFGVTFLAVTGHVNNVTILIASVLTTLVLAGTLVFGFVIGNKTRINAVFLTLTKGLNKFLKVIRPSHKPETIKLINARAVFDSLSDNYKLITSHRRQLRAPFLSALIINVTEILTIYVVYLAFGHWVNIGAVILAYAVANFAGMVSVLPGGVGIYEALMTAVLIASGVPAGLSLSVTVMYRVLSTLIQIPPGYVLYHRALRGRSNKFSEEVAAEAQTPFGDGERERRE